MFAGAFREEHLRWNEGVRQQKNLPAPMNPNQPLAKFGNCNDCACGYNRKTFKAESIIPARRDRLITGRTGPGFAQSVVG